MELTAFTKIVATLGVPGLVVGIIYVMLRLWKIKVSEVPRVHAAVVVIVIILVIGGLTSMIIDRVFPDEANPPIAVKPAPDRDLRFETRYEEAKFYPIDADKVRADFAIRFVPTTTDNGQAATIFLGMAKFHDNEKVDDIEAFRKNQKRCEESPSCIHQPVVWNWDQPPGNEKIIRGATDGTRHTFSAVLDRRVKHVLVYWEFYQREGDNGATCKIDTTRPQPPLDLPFVHSVKDGKRIEDRCYRAWEQKVVPVTISL